LAAIAKHGKNSLNIFSEIATATGAKFGMWHPWLALYQNCVKNFDR